MNFTVLWRRPAETTLLAALLRAANKPSYWTVVRDIDQRLSVSPLAEGESRQPDVRIAFFRPFEVLTIDEENRTVYVEQVKWVGA